MLTRASLLALAKLYIRITQVDLRLVESDDVIIPASLRILILQLLARDHGTLFVFVFAFLWREEYSTTVLTGLMLIDLTHLLRKSHRGSEILDFQLAA